MLLVVYERLSAELKTAEVVSIAGLCVRVKSECGEK